MLNLFKKKVDQAENHTCVVQRQYDRVLLTVTLLLMGFGVVMVYSASIVSAAEIAGDPRHFANRQMVYVGLALGGLLIGLTVHHDLWRRMASPAMAVGFVLLLLVLIPGLSSTAKGASRWISIGPLRFQSSEGIKLAWILFLAMILSRRQEKLHDFRAAWGQPLILFCGIAGLLLMQPDFGSTVICGALMVLMVWAAGGRWLHVGGFAALGVALAGVAIAVAPYRIKRLLAFLWPEEDPQGAAYHINQALISFGSGDWTGLGLGGSRQKLRYLPEAHTDCISSIIGEQLGFVGAGFVIICFAIFVWRGFKIAREATSAFGALLAFGITAEIGFQAATNMAVATAMLPTKGLTLPFVSYGGSSLITLGVAVGILLNISRQEPPPAWLHQGIFAPPPRAPAIHGLSRRPGSTGGAA